MTAIFDAKEPCGFSDRTMVFDTCVLIAIDGNDPATAGRIHYSNYLKSALDNGNTIVINECIIGEFFNRVCKIEYDLMYPDKKNRPYFKVARKNQKLQESIESVRDTCLNFLDDYNYEASYDSDLNMELIITEAAKGQVDFSDVVIIEQCKINKYVLVSHDHDLVNCGLELVTANQKSLR